MKGQCDECGEALGSTSAINNTLSPVGFAIKQNLNCCFLVSDTELYSLSPPPPPLLVVTEHSLTW